MEGNQSSNGRGRQRQTSTSHPSQLRVVSDASGSQARTNTFPSEPYNPANTASTQVQDASHQSKRKKHSRGKKNKVPDSVALAPSTSSRDPITTHSGNSMTWQQQGMLLNASAPSFEPPSSSSQPRPPLEQMRKNRNAPNQESSHGEAAQPLRKKKHRRAKKKNHTSTASSASHQPIPPPLLPVVHAEALAQSLARPTKVHPPDCIICCSPMYLVSFGTCNHHAACGRCALRLRKCYDNKECPLCKTTLDSVVIAPWRSEEYGGLPEFQWYREHPEATARSMGGELGPGAVWADTWHIDDDNTASSIEEYPLGPPTLLQELRSLTAIACRLCSTSFQRHNQLENHLTQAHGLYCCSMCLREGRQFPLDVELFKSIEERKEHEKKAHPKCFLCVGAASGRKNTATIPRNRQLNAAVAHRSYFDEEALNHHLFQQHFRCQLCDRQQIDTSSRPLSQQWFFDAETLRYHLQETHYACEDDDCRNCLVAFATSDELRRHMVVQHGGGMARWERGRATRELLVDFRYNNGNGEGYRTTEGQGHGGRQGRGRSNRRAGIRMIDDDLGLLDEHAIDGTMNRNNAINIAGEWGWNRSGVAQRHGQQQSGEEAFPSLATVIPTSTAANTINSTDNNNNPPPLVKHTIKCPCGRRRSHPVLPQGETPPCLPCDAVCELENRRSTLADAFGVENPSRHVSVFDRRNAVWSADLLLRAKKEPAVVQEIEKHLEAFVKSGERRRLLPVMSKEMRSLVHSIAEQYGIATASDGPEGRRGVQLFRSSTATFSTSSNSSTATALPNKLLSKVALSLTDQQIAALVDASRAFPVRFIDVAPTVDLRYYLRQWEGTFDMDWKGGTEAIVTFKSDKERDEVFDALGGGIRGLFRIDRSWKGAPREIDTGVVQETHGAGAAWGSGETANIDGGQGREESELVKRWSSVAVMGGNERTGREQEEERLPKGWAVIGGKARGGNSANRGVGKKQRAEPQKEENVRNFSVLSIDDAE